MEWVGAWASEALSPAHASGRGQKAKKVKEYPIKKTLHCVMMIKSLVS